MTCAAGIPSCTCVEEAESSHRLSSEISRLKEILETRGLSVDIARARLEKELVAVTAERDEAQRLEAQYRTHKWCTGCCSHPICRIGRSRDGLMAENERLRDDYQRVSGERRDAAAENARLRAAIAPTPENVMRYGEVFTGALFGGVFLSSDVKRAVEAFLTAIAARAGVKL